MAPANVEALKQRFDTTPVEMASVKFLPPRHTTGSPRPPRLVEHRCIALAPAA
eukprot:CAMPEP_0196662688 /NCGR_PEP_ID=MMETSP1086-20130531/49918_1 /TAXON_ID=77921 /ORGANISM="Cyanoptyche  gloeocystis , Strain SAG4.97" /LENGTH=52 /DNA_ID=CAMNT_0041998217 /DNA_START=67 /DNA_END=222 /DNA_ORIENTATION=+